VVTKSSPDQEKNRLNAPSKALPHDGREDGNGADTERVIEELREAIKARDDFLAVATHELRNPLTPILLCVQLIRAAQASNDYAKLTNTVDRLERQIKHFVARTNVLLEVGQITSGKLHLDPSKLNLSELIRGVVNDYMPLIIRSGSELNMNIQNDVTAYVDPMAVSEIVENLLSNAIKYGQSKPIEIAMTATVDVAHITVRDNGIGINENDKARIFERFERAVGRKTYSGFGIGLWLSRSFAELMGGSITAHGEPGGGSRFTVTLPIGPGDKVYEQ
jgi:two-component system OmpR family sensor kinase